MGKPKRRATAYFLNQFNPNYDFLNYSLLLYPPPQMHVPSTARLPPAATLELLTIHYYLVPRGKTLSLSATANPTC